MPSLAAALKARASVRFPRGASITSGHTCTLTFYCSQKGEGVTTRPPL